MSKCPFCAASIIEISFVESRHFCAIVNIAPILPGHSLIIPKRHVKSLLALDEHEVAEMVNLSRKAISLLMHEFKSEGFDWTIQEGEAAGQSVPHLHLHLIPRKHGDLPNAGDWYPRLIDNRDRPRLSHPEMKRIAQRLQSTRHE